MSRPQRGPMESPRYAGGQSGQTQQCLALHLLGFHHSFRCPRQRPKLHVQANGVHGRSSLWASATHSRLFPCLDFIKLRHEPGRFECSWERHASISPPKLHASLRSPSPTLSVPERLSAKLQSSVDTCKHGTRHIIILVDTLKPRLWRSSRHE